MIHEFWAFVQAYYWYGFLFTMLLLALTDTTKSHGVLVDTLAYCIVAAFWFICWPLQVLAWTVLTLQFLGRKLRGE